jgi:hypothetical protein
MHEATITVVSMRKDGKGLKAAWNGEEAWMDIPDSLRGRFEWKNTYPIQYTTTNKRDGSTGYVIKAFAGSSQAPAQGGHNKPPNGDPEYDLKIGAQAKFNALAPAMATMAVARDTPVDEKWIASLFAKCLVGHELGWDAYKKMRAAATLSARRPEPEFNDSLDDTF